MQTAVRPLIGTSGRIQRVCHTAQAGPTIDAGET